MSRSVVVVFLITAALTGCATFRPATSFVSARPTAGFQRDSNNPYDVYTFKAWDKLPIAIEELVQTTFHATTTDEAMVEQFNMKAGGWQLRKITSIEGRRLPMTARCSCNYLMLMNPNDSANRFEVVVGNFHQANIFPWRFEHELTGTTGPTEFKVTVHPERGIVQLINAGDYEYVYGNEQRKLSEFGSLIAGIESYEVTLTLIDVDRSMKVDEAVDFLKERGYRPATLAELLAFGSTYPDEQLRFEIAEVGSLWDEEFDKVARQYSLVTGKGNGFVTIGDGGDWRELNFKRYQSIRDPSRLLAVKL